MSPATRNLPGRLDKETWLEEALKVLAQKGGAGLRVQDICDALGVSRGSFYWHFKGRNDFTKSVLEYWHAVYTQPVPGIVDAKGGSPEERLLTLLTVVYEKNLVRYDIPVRGWAAMESKIAALVRKTDRFRLSYIRSLFEEMGFKNPELEIRTRAFMAYLLSEDVLFDPLSRAKRLAEISDRHAFFVRK